MKFALVDDIKQEAAPGMKGICPVCGAQCIAKCGERNINHWAHKSKKDCDHWWESETPWHRKWKDKFPKEWQEVIDYDLDTGEKHIADIRTDTGLVIEFQHSAIKPEEKKAREKFHKTMLWVVDGTRCPTWWKRFVNETWRGNRILKSSFFTGAEMCLPEIWQNSSVGVVFDFLGDKDINDPNGPQDKLYCLLPNTNAYAEMTIKEFLDKTINNSWLSSVNSAPNKIQRLLDKREKIWEEEIRRDRYEQEKAEYNELKEMYCMFDLPNKQSKCS